ncbi:MAG TPA: ImmA/IrrE family metallo-endopeptidase, partial [Rhabdaerophilum sp.]|nr:ImmA/IrrE family metallo-endopeptidase [Rhabdaerophilum sp.]
IQRRRNHFPELEAAAEDLWLENGLALFTLQQDLVKVLNARFAVDVEIAPADAMQGLLRHYNPLTRRLLLSELLPLSSRTFQLAHQIGFLGYRKEIEQAVSGGKSSSPEADALAAETRSRPEAAIAPRSRIISLAQ